MSYIRKEQPAGSPDSHSHSAQLRSPHKGSCPCPANTCLRAHGLLAHIAARSKCVPVATKRAVCLSNQFPCTKHGAPGGVHAAGIHEGCDLSKTAITFRCSARASGTHAQCSSLSQRCVICSNGIVWRLNCHKIWTENNTN